MLDYRLWQSKLETDLSGIVKKVGFAAEIKAVLKNAARFSPAIFIIPKDENAKHLGSTGSTKSLVTAGMDILIIAKNSTDALGDKAHDQLKTVRDAVSASLIGWKPADASTPVNYRSGKRFGLNQGFLIWADTFDCQFIKG